MKRRLLLFSILTAFSSLFLLSQTNDTEWKYFGQKPPKLKPEVFAPGIISGKGRMHCFPSFSPDGKEVVWMTLPPKLFFTKFKGNWIEPQQVSFSKIYRCLFPVFSYDGKRLYFSSNDVPYGFGGTDIWYIEKTDDGFSKPINIGSPINTNQSETQQVFTETGTIYYTGYLKGKRFNNGIFRSRFKNGKYFEPEILKAPINIIDTNIVDYTPFISRDESFLLFCSNRQNKYEEDCRIYLSFRDGNGNWSSPINLSDKIEFNKDSRNPYISPDGKYLFFCSGDNIYWLDAEIIEILKKTK
jgi:Tol biopolymer transport system component